MAKIIKPLTEIQIKNAKAKEKTYTIGDGGGMYLEINSNGGKWWRYRYELNGKTKKVSLGVYPATTLADARKKRDAARSILANEDRDPFLKIVAPINPQVVQKTFKEWAEWYIEEISKELSDSHVTRTLKTFRKDVYPFIGNMPINDIKTKDIINIMHIMKNRNATESARKTFSAISRVFAKAISNFPDDIERNPTVDISLRDVIGKKQTKNYPIITDPKELGILLKNIQDYTGDVSTRLALTMLAHVFTRPSNVRLAEWSEVDLVAKQWVIPAQKMKTNKELIVPLSKQIIELLEVAKQYSYDSELIFPSNRSRRSPMSDNAMVGALRRMGYSRDEIVAHSFRGIFSTIAHEKAIYVHDIIETQLAHTVGSQVSQAYNRAVYLKERTEMMQWWSDYLVEVQKRVQ
ncbi:MAG: tyrosine-type recombinase/integrase [Sulfurimonas sp.]|jgi:integrase|nr:tyrosine-type recombinase/integrase [Sulfurimonas sp.]MDX9757235.1 tyrosine-type recombinase/integrase [Sulfurimonas sp.]